MSKMVDVAIILIGALCSLAVAPTCAQERQAQGPVADTTIAVQSQLVEVHLTVTDGSSHVQGLDHPDFALLEDGVERVVHRLDTSKVPLRVALLVDSSGSMRGALDAIREAAVSFVESLSDADRVTFISFNSYISSYPQVSGDTEPIVQAIRATQPGGSTKLYEALLLAMKTLSGQDGRKAIVVFSDGEDTGRTSSLNLVVRAAGRFGYPIYTIGAGAGLKNEKLKAVMRELASINSGKMFFVDGLEDLRSAFTRVAEELRSAYVAYYYTDVPFDGNWHDLEVKTKDLRFRVQHRRGFYADASRTGALPPRRQGRRVRAARLLPDFPAQGPEIIDDAALNALAELMRKPAAAPTLASIPLPEKRQKKDPLYKVESRFVEVPVLVEPVKDRELPILSQEDFRVYEDGLLKEIIFFSRDVAPSDLSNVREKAIKDVRASGAPSLAASDFRKEPDLVLGRYYLVLDDVKSQIGPFLEMKKAARRILQEHHTPLHPFSLHFTSEEQVVKKPTYDTEELYRRIDESVPYGRGNFAFDKDVMSMYEAYLIEKGDTQATQLAELRLASTLALEFQNELGGTSGMTADGDELIDRSIISGVQTMARELIAENYGRVSRTLDGLKAVISAAASDRNSYPKVIVFISTGFVVGRESGRSAIGVQMQHIIGRARDRGIRIFSVDATGLDVLSTLEIQARPAFLVGNAHLETLMMDHAQGFKLERESALNQLALETGGRLLNMTNDLAAATGAAMRMTGHLYYLGYLSQQPPDGRYHKIRVAASARGVRVHTREGFSAGRSRGPDPLVADRADRQDSRNLMVRAAEAQDSGDNEQIVANLEPLAQRFPDQVPIWFNLGTAYLQLSRPDQAVEAFQHAFNLAPENRNVGIAFTRALLEARYREAAADTLRFMIRNRPGDLDLIVRLGRVYEVDSQLQNAYRTYRRVLDLTPAPPLELYPLLLRTATPLGRYLEGKLLIEDYLERGGDAQRIDPWLRRIEERVPN